MGSMIHCWKTFNLKKITEAQIYLLVLCSSFTSWNDMGWTSCSHISSHVYWILCILSKYLVFHLDTLCLIFCLRHLPFWYISYGHFPKNDTDVTKGKEPGEERKTVRGRKSKYSYQVTDFPMNKLIRGQVDEIETNGWTYCIHPSGYISPGRIQSKLDTTSVFYNTKKQDGI